MTKLGMAVFGAVIAIAGCNKSKCEKYADMEVKCGAVPEKEKDMTHALAQAFCSDDSADSAGAKEISSHIKSEAECATKTTDCAEYKKCTSAIK